MMAQVEADEWRLLLDDDAKLLRDTYVAELLDHAALLDPKKHFGVPLTMIDVTSDGQPGRVSPVVSARHPRTLNMDISNLLIHGSHKHHIRATERCAGDKRMYKQLLAARLRPVVIAVAPGIWANYRGAMGGRG